MSLFAILLRRQKLTQQNLPINRALCNTGKIVQEEAREEPISELKSDASKAVWVFLIINICVVLLALIGNKEFVFAAIFIQFGLILLWLLPVFLYQVLIKKQAVVLSILKALASYKNLMGQVQWP